MGDWTASSIKFLLGKLRFNSIKASMSFNIIDIFPETKSYIFAFQDIFLKQFLIKNKK